LDRLGAEMMYPKASTGHKLACSDRCFLSASGTIVRADGATTIDWVARGADVDPVWHIGSQTLQNADGRLPAASLMATTNVTMEFPDAYSNPHRNLFIPQAEQHPLLTGGGTIVKSDALHTAIVDAITTVLL
jgi:hypothetical protein